MYPASAISAGQGHKQDISGMWGKGNHCACGVCVCVCVSVCVYLKTAETQLFIVAFTYTFLGKLDLFVPWSSPSFLAG